jgi:hypothetical protein
MLRNSIHAFIVYRPLAKLCVNNHKVNQEDDPISHLPSPKKSETLRNKMEVRKLRNKMIQTDSSDDRDDKKEV